MDIDLVVSLHFSITKSLQQVRLPFQIKRCNITEIPTQKHCCELWGQGELPSYASFKKWKQKKYQSNQLISGGEFECYLLHPCIILSTVFIKPMIHDGLLWLRHRMGSALNCPRYLEGFNSTDDNIQVALGILALQSKALNSAEVLTIQK